MSPPDYPSAWLLPGRARFRFARQIHCSSAPSFYQLPSSRDTRSCLQPGVAWAGFVVVLAPHEGALGWLVTPLAYAGVDRVEYGRL